MNRPTLFAILAVLGLGLGVRVHSQSAAPKGVFQELQAIKAANATLLERQTVVMGQLDELQKAAEQTKFMVKRG